MRWVAGACGSFRMTMHPCFASVAIRAKHSRRAAATPVFYRHRPALVVAPFSGEHGWYWLNISEKPVTIKLTVTGYYDKMVDYGVIP